MKINIFGYEVKITVVYARGLNSAAGWERFKQDAYAASPRMSSRWIAVIKHYRETYGTGLVDARNAVDALCEKHGDNLKVR